MRTVGPGDLGAGALAERAVAASRLLSSVPRPARAALVASSTGRVLSRHEPLRLQGARDDVVFVVVEGFAKEHVLTPSGEDRLTGLIGRGANVGIETAFAGATAATCITALCRMVVLAVPGAVLRDVVSSGGGREVVAELAGRVAAAVTGCVEVTSLPAPARVVSRLVELVDTWSVPGDDGLVITAPITQEELGSWAGVSRESVAKVLHDLRDAGLLRTGRRQLVVTRPEELRGWVDRSVEVPALVSGGWSSPFRG